MVHKFLFSLYQCWQEDRVSTFSSSLAYYSIFSLAPLIVICTSLIGLAVGPIQAEKEVIDIIALVIGQESANQLHIMIQHAHSPITGFTAELISFTVLIIGSSGIFSQMQLGLNVIWAAHNPPKGSFRQAVKEKILSFILVFGVALLLLVSLLFNAVLTAANEYISKEFPIGVWVAWLLYFTLSFLGITLLFAMIYKILPNIKLKWTEVLLGAVIASVLFTIGKFLLGLYIGAAHVGNAFGPAGSLIIILVWLYYSAQILFIGAEIIKLSVTKRHHVEEKYQ